MIKILITGASGFIGGHCFNLLIKKGYEVHAISRNPPEKGTKGNAFWYAMDLFELDKVEEVLKNVRPTHFIHLAWKMETGLSLNYSENEKWRFLSQNLVDLFYRYGGKRILVSGSCFEYDLSYKKFNENTTPVEPNNGYGKNKNIVHQYLQSFSNKNGLSYVWARVFFTFGSGQNSASLLPHVMSSLHHNKIVETTHGNQMYDYLYVEDVASALLLLLESSHIGAVNVCSGKATKLKDLILKVSKIFQKDELIKFGARPVPPNSPKYVVGNNELLKKVTGWSPQYTLDKAIEKTVKQYKIQK